MRRNTPIGLSFNKHKRSTHELISLSHIDGNEEREQTTAGEAVHTRNGPRHSQPNGVSTKLLTITFDGITFDGIIRAGHLIVTAGLIRGSGHRVGRIGLKCNGRLVKHCLGEMFPRPKWLEAEVPLVNKLLNMDNHMPPKCVLPIHTNSITQPLQSVHTGHVSATFSVSIYCVRARLTSHLAPHRAVSTLSEHTED